LPAFFSSLTELAEREIHLAATYASFQVSDG
jgi:hypothetical protein